MGFYLTTGTNKKKIKIGVFLKFTSKFKANFGKNPQCTASVLLSPGLREKKQELCEASLHQKLAQLLGNDDTLAVSNMLTCTAISLHFYKQVCSIFMSSIMGAWPTHLPAPSVDHPVTKPAPRRHLCADSFPSRCHAPRW